MQLKLPPLHQVPEEYRYKAAIGALMVALLVVIWATFDSYGFTTDDDFGYLRALGAYKFFSSLGAEASAYSKLRHLHYYGAMPDTLALLLKKAFSVLSFDSRHLVSALFGVAGIFFTYLLASRTLSPLAGLLAALFLSCNPMWFGYMFINIKDIPFAATLLAAYYFSMVSLTERQNTLWVFVAAGAATALLASTKLTGILVLGAWCFITLVCLALVPSNKQVTLNRTFFGRAAMLALLSAVFCVMAFAFFWPQFYFLRLDQTIEVATRFLNYDFWNGKTLLNGTYYAADQTPWYYISVYFLISLPAFLLPLLAAGVWQGAARREPYLMAFVLIILFFFVYQALSGARVYGGYRHFLFLLPLMMIVAAYPVALIFERARPVGLRASVACFVAIGLLASIVAMYRTFPYQYSTYNLLVGGLPGADGKYYIDVWRSAYREALTKAVAMSGMDRPIYISSCGPAITDKEFSQVIRVENSNDANYVIALRRLCFSKPDERMFDRVGDVRREGVVFATIYKSLQPRGIKPLGSKAQF